MDAVLEVLNEAVREIADKPLTFIIELVQFGILLLLMKVVAFGTKKRRGMVTNMLAERRARVAAELTLAEAGHEALMAAKDEVERIAAEAEDEAAAIAREARKQARTQRADILADGEAQAAAIATSAREALEREQAEMLQGIRDQLVEVVTQATQQLLAQGFSPAEQRTAVQKAIIAGIEGLESVTTAS